MRCPYCKVSNPHGETRCRVCGARLQARECGRCHHHNPPGYNFCGLCGRPLELSRMPSDNVEDTQEPVVVVSSRGLSPVWLMGFGAVLALASVAFPWYVLSHRVDEAYPTLSQQLAQGWELFPGLPLLVIGLASIVSALLGILAGRGRLYPVASMVSGIVILFFVTWLWQGLQDLGTAQISVTVPVDTGPMLAGIGAIIILVGGSLIARMGLLR